MPKESVVGYGFRYDPIRWAENDTSLHAAEVRRFVLGRPNPEDQEIFAAKIDDLLEEQQEDGRIGTHPIHPVLVTSEALVNLANLGATDSDPRIENALGYLLAQKGYDAGLESVPGSVFDAMSCFGRTDIPGIQDQVKAQIDDTFSWIHLHCLCPWTPAKGLISLWRNRHHDDRSIGTIERGLRNIAAPLNAAGCASYNDPWGYLDAAATVDLPTGREIIEKQIPMILRSQKADGGWGENSHKVFRALRKCGSSPD